LSATFLFMFVFTFYSFSIFSYIVVTIAFLNSMFSPPWKTTQYAQDLNWTSIVFHQLSTDFVELGCRRLSV